jgi:phosphoglycerol geranylgeranyltransferase
VAKLDIRGACELLLNNEVKKNRTILVSLIDPENFTPKKAALVASKSQKIGISAIFVGGSTIVDQRQLDYIVIRIRKNVTIPVILFPGNITGISKYANAILFSSLLNSNNPYYIIGAQAIGAIHIWKHKLEAIPMGYLVFGENSTTGFIGQVNSIPFDKPSIAIMYALAAQYMGMRAIYLEAGSGSAKTIPTTIIKAIRRYFKGLLIVGGGITDPEIAKEISKAGADILVIGNLLQTKIFENKLIKIVKAVRNIRL